MRKRISEKDVNNISHYLLENGYVGETTQDENDCFDWNYTKKKKIGDDTEMRSNVSFLKMSDGKFECNISIQIENIEYGCINNGLSADSKEALKGKRGEDIVNADVASQGYEATKAETDRDIEIK